MAVILTVGVLLPGLGRAASLPVKSSNRCEVAFSGIVNPATALTLGQTAPLHTIIQEPAPRLAKRVAPVSLAAKSWETQKTNEELEALRITLTQAERSLIFYVLVDHPRMLFGELGAKLLDLRGHHKFGTPRYYVERPEPHRLENAYFSMKEELLEVLRYDASRLKKKDVPTYYPASYEYERRQFARATLEALVAISQTKPDAQTKQMKGNYEGDHIELATNRLGLFKSLRLSKGAEQLYKSQKTDASISKNYDYTSYAEFRDFFVWLNSSRDRMNYARQVILRSFRPWVAVIENSEQESAATFAENQTRLLREDREPRFARMGLGVMNARKRYLESIRNSKLDLGFAVYAFPESSAIETAKDSESADKPLYVASAAKLIGDYAPKLSATEIDYFGIDTAGEISSARKFRLLSTKAALDVSALNSSVKQVWVHADAFFASLKMTGTLEGATAKNLATLDQLQAASDAIEQDAVHLKQFIGNVRDSGSASLHALQTILRSTTDADERSQLETEIAELRTTLAKLATMQEESRTLFSASLSGIGKIISDSQRQLLDAIQ